MLDYAARRATGYRVLRMRGVAAERELPYAALHLLCAPVLGDLDALEPGHRTALTTAVGVTPGLRPDRRLVSLAALNLLTSIAATQPVCCLVDDAHLLDHASLLVLAFVARHAERASLLVVFAEPEDERSAELDGLPELNLEPLAWEDGRAVLTATEPGRVDPAVTERLLIEARGNPRALVEAFDGIAASELAGGYAIPAPRPGHNNHHDHDCVKRARRLRPAAWCLLVVAAAEPTGDPTVVWRAAATLGVGVDAAQALEAEELVSFGPRVVFRCTQLRAAVYEGAGPAERRAAHRALADATESDVDADRRAWHRALSTDGLDDEVADRLERYAPAAHARGGVAADAAFLEMAALFSSDPRLRSQRALAAAATKYAAGATDAAQRLLAVAEIALPDGALQARIMLQRARIAFTVRRDSTAPGMLLEAARQVQAQSLDLADQAYLEALVATMVGGRLSTTSSVRDVARAARAAADGKAPVEPVSLLLAALVTRALDGYVTASAPLRKAFESFQDGNSASAACGWRWLASRVAADLWDERAWAALSAPQQLDNVSGSDDCVGIGGAPIESLVQVALVDLYGGRFDGARSALSQAEAGATAAGTAPVTYPSLLLAAWQGQRGPLLDLLPSVRRDAIQRSDGLALAAAGVAEAVLENGAGNYKQAVVAARNAAASDHLALSNWALPELIEAAVRSGDNDTAAGALARLSERTHAAGTNWALGIQAASAALLADDEDAERLFQEGIGRLNRTDVQMHVGRAQLCYGEWLRRQNRRVDARLQLRAAMHVFAAAGAEGFVERTSSELRATGERARRRSVDTARQLTPQESRIAYLARDGLTNPEIGATLFVSPRTVEYHLHKVFTKLAIASRTQLHLVLDGTSDARRGAPARGAAATMMAPAEEFVS